ncbi:MAG TPA: hypothetical protein VNT03_18910 [Baekduia sp.]|nr:hypothetical protein [Baekduia sp.]
MRVTFLGRPIDHRPWALGAPAGDVVPAFVEHGEGIEAVRATRPDAVVVFTPRETDGAALRAETGALTLAVVTDEGFAPEVADVWSPGSRVPEAPALPVGYDRVLATDPLLARAAGAWRSAPLPVDDALFAETVEPAPAPHTPPRVVFRGEMTTWRSFWLPEFVEHYGLVHVQPGEPFADAFAQATVGLCVREERDRATFPPDALLHLAAGRLLVTEPLRPLRGLEPDLDHVEVREQVDALHVLHQVCRRPAAFEHVRMRARIRMEQFRASVVWPRVLADLKADVAAYATTSP